MAGKRKKKARTREESLGTPSKWRLQHGGFSEPVREADPETGTPVLHRRAIDTLGLMLANGTITQEMHDAGGCFRALFRRASLDGMVRSPLVRLPGKSADALSERTIDARRKVADALDALGGQCRRRRRKGCWWRHLPCSPATSGSFHGGRRRDARSPEEDCSERKQRKRSAGMSRCALESARPILCAP
jgi:hypothetical protein